MADLIRQDFHKLYKDLGRDKFIATLNAHPEIDSPKKMKEVLQ